MSDLITRLKNMSNNAKNCSDAEIQFLQKSDLTIVIPITPPKSNFIFIKMVNKGIKSEGISQKIFR